MYKYLKGFYPTWINHPVNALLINGSLSYTKNFYEERYYVIQQEQTFHLRTVLVVGEDQGGINCFQVSLSKFNEGLYLIATSMGSIKSVIFHFYHLLKCYPTPAFRNSMQAISTVKSEYFQPLINLFTLLGDKLNLDKVFIKCYLAALVAFLKRAHVWIAKCLCGRFQVSAIHANAAIYLETYMKGYLSRQVNFFQVYKIYRIFKPSVLTKP